MLTEKPMVCSVDHAFEVMDKSEAVGKILMVSYQRHLSPTFRFIRSQIQAGEIGEVQFIQAMQDQHWYENQQGKWRQLHASLWMISWYALSRWVVPPVGRKRLPAFKRSWPRWTE